MRLRLNPSPLDHRVSAFRAPHCALILIVWFVGLFAAQLFAQPNPDAPTLSSNRFLFIIDTSSAMKRHQADTLKVVNDIITNAATGQMRPGDSLGLWTFNQEVYSDLPVQLWTGNNRDSVAQLTLDFLKRQHYGKASHLEKALADLWPVVKDSELITVFIISNGHGKMSGTPLDNDVNALYKQTLADMKSKPRPIITVLQARRGKLVRCTVTAVPWPVVIPEIPIPIRHTAPAQVAATPVQPATTNAPAPVAKATVPPLILPKPKAALPPPVSPPSPTASVTPETNTVPASPPVSPAPVAKSEIAPAVVPLPPATASNPVPPPNAPNVAAQAVSVPTTTLPPNPSAPLPVTPPLPSSAQNIQPPTATTAPPVVPAAPAPKPTLAQLEEAVRKSHSQPPKVLTNPVVAVSPVETTSRTPTTSTTPTNESLALARTNALVAEPASNSVSSQALGFVAPVSPTRSKTLLFAGLALLGIGILLLILLLRRTRSPSLISETMRNDKQK